MFRKGTWQQELTSCVCATLLYSRFVIIPSSRNTCHASSSLFVICCFTSSCPDRRDRTVDFGLKKTVRHCTGSLTGLSEKLTYFDLCFDFPAACDSYFKTFNKFYQGFWTYLYFRIRHSLAHVWTILNKMAAFGVIAHVRTILNKMASFGVNICRSSASEHGQNITNITTIEKTNYAAL